MPTTPDDPRLAYVTPNAETGRDAWDGQLLLRRIMLDNAALRSPSRVRPPAQFAAVIYGADGFALFFDCTLEESHNLESDASEYPVDGGGLVTDHIRRKPVEVQLSAIVTNTPNLAVQSARVDQFVPRNIDRDAWTRLVDLHDKGDTVDLVLALGSFTEMALIGLSTRHAPEMGQSIRPSLRFRQIVRAQSESITLPAKRLGPQVKAGLEASTDQGTQVAKSGATPTLSNRERIEELLSYQQKLELQITESP